jgi:hypothetical protein
MLELARTGLLEQLVQGMLTLMQACREDCSTQEGREAAKGLLDYLSKAPTELYYRVIFV